MGYKFIPYNLGVLDIDIILYIYMFGLAIRATQPSISSCSSKAFTGNLGMRPVVKSKISRKGFKVAPTIGFRFIDITLYIYIFWLSIRATPGRPYRVTNDFVGAGLSSPFCNPESVYLGNRGIDMIPYIYRFCLAYGRLQLFISSSSLSLLSLWKTASDLPQFSLRFAWLHWDRLWTGSPLQGGEWFCRGLLVKPVCKPEYVYFGIVGIGIIPYIYIVWLTIRAWRMVCRGWPVQPFPQSRICLFRGYGYWYDFLYLHLLIINTGGTGPPLQLNFLDIDIVLYIYISCIPIRATPGRPYRVTGGL